MHDNRLPILGTQYTSIDLAEDRDRFRNLLNKLKLKQAKSGIAKTFSQALNIAEKIGLPLMVRPSYVLGGRAMEIVHEKNNLRILYKNYLRKQGILFLVSQLTTEKFDGMRYWRGPTWAV